MTNDQIGRVDRTVVSESPAGQTVSRATTARYASRFSGVYRDRVSWGAIWGGLLTAMGLFILLSVLAAAIGITAAQETQVAAGDVNRVAGVVSAVLALLSFFVGGYITGLGSGAAGHEAGALNGFLVWALALALMLVFAGLGLGQLFGVLTENFMQLRGVGTGQVDPQALAEGAQTAAWIGFISLALAATAATLGGWLGAATDDEEAVA